MSNVQQVLHEGHKLCRFTGWRAHGLALAWPKAGRGALANRAVKQRNGRQLRPSCVATGPSGSN